jgi:hypothetical protein
VINVRKKVKATVYLTVFIVLGLFLLLTDVKGQKATFAQIKPEESHQAVVILVDNSGSMGRCSVRDSQGKCLLDAEQPYRLESVKDVLSQRISQGSFTGTKVGLVELGNWKSYGLSYENRCDALKPLVFPRMNSRDEISESLREININSNGVTPIAFAINAVVQDIFRKSNLFPAKIALITDGAPNCTEKYKNNLCDIVAGLAARKVDLEIDIFGFKAKGQDDEFISCAKKFPDMVKYFPSETPAGLDHNIGTVFSPLPISSSSPSKPLPTLTSTPAPIQPTQALLSSECLLRKSSAMLLIAFCVLLIALGVVIAVSLLLPNSSGWVGIVLLKQSLSDPARVTSLIAILGVLAAAISGGATALQVIPCN